MLFDAVCRFVALTKQVGVKGSDSEVKKLMVTLRRSGFSSSKISELSGGKWSSTLIRQYTTGWGGVDKELDNQRKSLMTHLRELASSGKDINDVEQALIIDRSVRASGSRIEELVELNSNLTNINLLPGEIGKLVTLSWELYEQHLNPSNVKAWMTVDQNLVEEGFRRPVRIRLNEACQKFGGLEETLNAVNKYNDLSEIQLETSKEKKEREQLRSEVKKLSNNKEDLDTYINQNREMIEATNNASDAGFNSPSLNMISVLAMNLGGPYKVVEAVRKYSSLREIDKEIETKKAELNNVNKEITFKSGYLTTLNYTLNEVKDVYQKNSDVRLLVELLVNPRGIKMEKTEIVRILTKVLDSCIQRIEENPVFPLIPNSDLDTIVQNITVLGDRLRNFSE